MFPTRPSSSLSGLYATSETMHAMNAAVQSPNNSHAHHNFFKVIFIFGNFLPVTGHLGHLAFGGWPV